MMTAEISCLLVPVAGIDVPVLIVGKCLSLFLHWHFAGITLGRYSSSRLDFTVSAWVQIGNFQPAKMSLR